MKKIPQADLSIREVVGEAVTYTLRAREEVPGAIFDVGSAGRRMELISKSPRSRAPAHCASGPVGVEPTGVVQQPNTDPTDRSDAFSAAERLDDEDYRAYSMGRAAEILGVTVAFLRGLDAAELLTPQRSPGWHRRYSRYQLRIAARARALVDSGTRWRRRAGSSSWKTSSPKPSNSTPNSPDKSHPHRTPTEHQQPPHRVPSSAHTVLPRP
jgi:hypothetical protein